jgi:ribosomal protein S14
MKKGILKDKKTRFSCEYVELDKLKIKILLRTNTLLKRSLLTIPKNFLRKKLVRAKNRCVITGRSQGVCSFFRLSRIKFREFSLNGLINGIKKASW